MKKRKQLREKENTHGYNKLSQTFLAITTTLNLSCHPLRLDTGKCDLPVQFGLFSIFLGTVWAAQTHVFCEVSGRQVLSWWWPDVLESVSPSVSPLSLFFSLLGLLMTKQPRGPTVVCENLTCIRKKETQREKREREMNTLDKACVTKPRSFGGLSLQCVPHFEIASLRWVRRVWL